MDFVEYSLNFALKEVKTRKINTFTKTHKLKLCSLESKLKRAVKIVRMESVSVENQKIRPIT